MNARSAEHRTNCINMPFIPLAMETVVLKKVAWIPSLQGKVSFAALADRFLL